MSTPASKEDIEELMRTFADRNERLVDQKLSEITLKFEGKLKSNKDVLDLKWKREGHKKQFMFNKSIIESLEDVLLINDSPAIDEKIREIKDSILRRQKLIRIADTSVSGWATVDEYVSKEMADDSDDDRRLVRAETRAARKLKAKQSKSSQSSKRFKNFGSSNPATVSSLSSTSNQPFRGTRFRPYPVPTDTCYTCGGAGHWRKHCTAAYKFKNQGYNQANKSYQS